MMGSRGLTEASKIAILNANYMAKRLEVHFTSFSNKTIHSMRDESKTKRESNLLILFLTEALPSSVPWCQRNSSTRIHHRSERLQGIII